MRPSVDDLRARFAERFPAATIEVIDESHLHAGRAGHFRLRLVSERFAGLGTVARHRLVYDAVRDWMPQRVHALMIDARTPTEAS